MFEDDEHNLTFAPTVSSEPLPGIYPFRGTVWLRLIDPGCERWSVQVGARMVRNQVRVAFTLSELPTPGFTVFDVGGYFAVTDHFRINLAVENLLDRQYTEHGSLVLVNRAGQAVFVKEPGINVFVGAELTY